MHEAGIADDILAVVLQYAEGRKITAVKIKVGELAGINTDSLLFHLECLSQEKHITPLKFDIQKIPAVFICQCGHQYQSVDPLMACPVCGGYEREIIEGKDCIVENIEVKDE